MQIGDRFWKKVGKIKDAHGLKGDFHISIFSGDTTWMPRLDQILLIREGDLASAEVVNVQRVRPFKDGLILKVEEVLDRTRAETYKGRAFFIPEELLISKEGETIYLNEILNFSVKDLDAKVIGKIVGFSSNGAQDLLRVAVEGEEKQIVEIPFVAPLVRKIDFRGFAVLMDVPEGLLQINLVK